MVGDGRGVACVRMPLPPQTGLLRRHRRRAQSGRACESRERQPLPSPQADAGQVVAQRQDTEDVSLHAEGAGDVRARETQLTGRREHVAQRIG